MAKRRQVDNCPVRAEERCVCPLLTHDALNGKQRFSRFSELQSSARRLSERCPCSAFLVLHQEEFVLYDYSIWKFMMQRHATLDFLCDSKYPFQ